MKNVLFVAAGGFFGTIARYLIQQFFSKQCASHFPYGTLLINITGCFLIGFLVALFEKNYSVPTEWQLFFTTGFCGGFTTFSAFALENMQLLKTGNTISMLVYIFISITAGLLFTIAGYSLSKSI